MDMLQQGTARCVDDYVLAVAVSRTIGPIAAAGRPLAPISLAYRDGSGRLVDRRRHTTAVRLAERLRSAHWRAARPAWADDIEEDAAFGRFDPAV